ncbi:MAG: glycosyltransferase family 4 protein [Candidatus Altiarchaeota archaeon]|nr:glycosyltransferase family 4 protein [Candidatus Altiarchaeota archaeon]
MEILLVSTDFPYVADTGTMTQGGGGACVAQLAEALSERGIDITVVTSQEPGMKKELFAFPIHRTKFYNLGFRESKITHSIPATMEVLRLTKKQGFDIIHTHNPTAGITGCIAKRLSQIPHLMTLHGPWAGVRQNPLVRATARLIEGKTVRCSDMVTCDSSALRDETLLHYKQPENKVVAIPNAVDTRFFDPKKASKRKAREELGLSMEKKLIFYTGRFVGEKGLPYLLDAFKEVSHIEDLDLLLLGGGFDEHLIQGWLAGNPGLSSRIHVIPYLPYGKMPYAYLACDIFVLPTLAEGMSRSILEAMACEKPVVATRIGGNTELLSGDRGILVRPKSPEDIAKAIERLRNEKLAKKLGIRSRQFVQKNNTIKKRVDSFIEVYEDMLR